MENSKSYNVAQQNLSSNLVLPYFNYIFICNPDVTGQSPDAIYGSAHSNKESW